MIRILLAVSFLGAAFAFALTDEWRMVNLCCTAGAVLAAWSAVRPTYGRA